MKKTALLLPVALLLTSLPCAAQGPLTPPGAPAPTMKTLEQVEPRTPISSADYVISNSGSYYLTSNLTATAGQNGITVNADDVTIDLNGFTLIGSGATSGHGIYQSFALRNLRVHNGKVVQWRGASKGGVYAFGNNNQIDHIQATTNYVGILSGRGSRISDCSADKNAVGIISGYGSMVSGCTASYNTGEGIIGTGSTISGCSVFFNTGSGIRVDYDSQLTGNTCRHNGFGSGDGAGIWVTSNGNRIESNSTTDNDRGIDVDGAENYVADNIVRSNTDNYDIAAGNQLNILLCEVPEDIDWPASVKFAGTLICTSTTTNGITVKADDVTINMAGHALVGPGSNSGNGIDQDYAYRNLRVHNGKVVHWRGGDGVYARGVNNQFDHIHVASNKAGIATAEGSTISDCAAYNNSGFGLWAGEGSTISGCTARGNLNSGITAGRGSMISDCTVVTNGVYAIYAGAGSTISGCAAYNNTGSSGISAQMGSTISGCAAFFNAGIGIYGASGSTISDCSAYYNAGDGILVNSESQLSGNTCDGNGSGGDGAGIHVTTFDNRIDSNNVTNNDRGIEADCPGNLIIRNSASGNGTNYVIAASNKVGVIVSAPNSPAISGSSGGVGVGSTDPWANFSF